MTSEVIVLDFMQVGPTFEITFYIYFNYNKQLFSLLLYFLQLNYSQVNEPFFCAEMIRGRLYSVYSLIGPL